MALPSFKGLLMVVACVAGLSEAAQWWQDKSLGRSIRAQAQVGDIVVYTTDTCPYCHKALRWLNTHQVPHRECNVDRSAACLAVFQAQQAPGVPLLQVRTQWQLGFEPNTLLKLLQSSPSTPRGPRP